MTLALAAYRALTRALWPAARLYLDRRLKRGKEDATRFAERLGHAGRPRPAGRLVWVHAASVGESLSLLPLIERVAGSSGNGGAATHVLVTTGTVTSAKLMGARLPPGAVHQYVPVDHPAFVARFLDHWRPALAIWAESDFWPNILTEAARRDLPLVLVQGRISDRSFARWRRAPKLIAEILSGFSLCLGQTERDAERLRVLGAKDARAVGNLKFSGPPLPVDAKELTRFGAAWGARPRWLAASTHPGEEEIAARVHRALAPRFPGLLTAIAPRHPERGGEIAATLRGLGCAVARRGAAEAMGPDTDIYLADTMGELGLLYRLCPIAFVGKSLSVAGGQNPLEPARLGCAVAFGPRMDNFAEVAERMCATGAARQVADEEMLAGTVSHWLADPAARARAGAAGEVFARAEAHALDAVYDALRPLLDRSRDARA